MVDSFFKLSTKWEIDKLGISVSIVASYVILERSFGNGSSQVWLIFQQRT